MQNLRSAGKLKNYFSSLVTRSVFPLLSLGLFAFYPLKVALIAVLFIFAQFLFNSLNSLILYHQKFKLHLSVNAVGFLIILLVIFYLEQFSVLYLLLAYVSSFLLKFVLIAIDLKLFSQRVDFKFDKKYILAASPFFLISLSGWLQSKADLYIVDYYLEPSDLSSYQVLISAFIMLQGASALIIQPFSKHIYRIKDEVIKRAQLILAIAGLAIVCIGSVGIWAFIVNFTELHFETKIYLTMALASLPTFLYMVNIYNHYKKNKEQQVMKINFLGAIVNIALGIFLVPNHGVFGAVLGICASQWLILMAYKLKKHD